MPSDPNTARSGPRPGAGGPLPPEEARRLRLREAARRVIAEYNIGAKKKNQKGTAR